MKFYVYILECADKAFYIGYTNDLINRLELHNKKKASKYTRSRVPVKYVYIKEFLYKSEAMRAEVYLKQLTRAKKKKVIDGSLLYEDILRSKMESK